MNVSAHCIFAIHTAPREWSHAIIKIVLVGAGSLQFGTSILGDFFRSDVLTGAQIVLNDINDGAVKRTETIANAYIARHGLNHHVMVDGDLGGR